MASQIPFLGTQWRCSLSFLTFPCIMGTLVHRVSKHWMAQQWPGPKGSVVHTRRDFLWWMMACLKVILGKNIIHASRQTTLILEHEMMWQSLVFNIISWNIWLVDWRPRSLNKQNSVFVFGKSCFFMYHPFSISRIVGRSSSGEILLNLHYRKSQHPLKPSSVWGTEDALKPNSMEQTN